MPVVSAVCRGGWHRGCMLVARQDVVRPRVRGLGDVEIVALSIVFKGVFIDGEAEHQTAW